MSLVHQMMAEKLGMAGGGDTPAPDAPPPEDGGGDALTQAMTDLHTAMQAGDIEGMATAFKAGFMACESEPHEESGEMEPPEAPEGQG